MSKTCLAKTCTKCQITKPLASFGLHRITRDGHNHRCFDCTRRAMRAVNAHRVARKRPPGQRHACKAVHRAVRAGALIKSAACHHCHTETALQAHHYLGYQRQFWLDVQWLCRSCHAFANRKRKHRTPWWKGMRDVPASTPRRARGRRAA